ncbi:hypothetical protein TSTA_086270 [Talaromyces stipitatus ATCC 10500]|uniref:Uncharacterized protein n=1 Tax=Talaromyces stipitatus (strain ATCC 10500 / CBS 375.48 / QM 6759 / NRRL 1006) TaxID=441959 RepID=B8M0L3_TALSN|nr:uncharacterized protein TSTA_086270 [Talaromyces stipitatus ATCC 10500]EED21396.1 hypothetical protein TSTA_086270 [Talaromyces stipitatus ATCC 10500]
MNPTSKEIISTMTKFYEFIVKLPYMDTTAVLYPPNFESGEQQGWPDINAEELRKRGRTEGTITLLRHLPYLRKPTTRNSKKGWMIGPNTHAIAYCDGEVYDEELDKIQPTPGHCIWLANATNTEDGSALLLDIESGTVTEYAVRSSRTVCLNIEEYEYLSQEDRWMAHFTLPAAHFFRLWIDKYKNLEWMPCFKEGDYAETVTWFINSQGLEGLLDDTDSGDSDESYEPSSEKLDDDDYDSEEYDPYEFNSEYESDGIDDIDDIDDIPVDEDTLDSKVAELKLDDGEDSTHGVRSQAFDRLGHEIRSGNSKLLTTDKSALEARVHEARSIYIGNGWPDSFNRDECQRQLSDLLKQITNSS